MMKSKYTIPHNHVLLRPHSDHKRWMGLSVDTEMAEHRSVYATVVAVPNRLVFCPMLGSKSLREQRYFQRMNQLTMEHETVMELEVGDIVMVHHRARAESEVLDDGNVMVLYKDVVTKVVGLEMFEPINGNVMVHVDDFVIGEGRAVSNGRGMVLAVSRRRNTGYMYSRVQDTFDPKPFDRIVFNHKQGQPLEHPMHEEHGQVVFIRRKDIFCTINELE